ncbi:YtrH family sporulation protein [Bacillus sp. T33-2]|uniref:YtrH family sporulation protein n=1 Tax=Bacillus sp. T33-2 TaxID=2054168 RepID=UPI000C76DD57|nr:YtrH family sporulation protein [Bacillus sp. T33-2]PLR98127.1 sporulation protein [Bacillus sp. T33-2]
MMNQPFFTHLFEAYFIALGVLLGGSVIGGLASFLTGQPLLTEIVRISDLIRIWAIIAAIGGTFDTVYSFERGFLEGETKDIVKQFLLILSAMGGAQTGALIINWLTQEHVSQ